MWQDTLFAYSHEEQERERLDLLERVRVAEGREQQANLRLREALGFPFHHWAT